MFQVHFWHCGRIGPYAVTSPMVLGHESSGVIAEVGSQVTHLKPGDRVAIEPGVPCRRCDMVFAALPPHDGTLAKDYRNASDLCYRIPDHMDLEQAAMGEPVAVAVAMGKTANLRAHQTVVVLGCGPIGILCQSVAKAWGGGGRRR